MLLPPINFILFTYFRYTFSSNHNINFTKIYWLKGLEPKNKGPHLCRRVTQRKLNNLRNCTFKWLYTIIVIDINLKGNKKTRDMWKMCWNKAFFFYFCLIFAIKWILFRKQLLLKKHVYFNTFFTYPWSFCFLLG